MPSFLGGVCVGGTRGGVEQNRERDQITDGLELKERKRISDRCALLLRHAAVPFYGTISVLMIGRELSDFRETGPRRASCGCERS